MIIVLSTQILYRNGRFDAKKALSSLPTITSFANDTLFHVEINLKDNFVPRLSHLFVTRKAEEKGTENEVAQMISRANRGYVPMNLFKVQKDISNFLSLPPSSIFKIDHVIGR